MNSIVNDLEKENKKLLEDNIELKQEIRKLKNKIEVLAENEGNSSTPNADMLRRISKLEKIIYGKE